MGVRASLVHRTAKNWSGQMAEELAFLSRAGTWDAFFAEARVAEFRRRLYLDAFAGEYPEEAATDGYITRSELSQMADTLRVRLGDLIVDLGCGRGGPGQWIAQTTGASLLGIDFSEAAIAQAMARSQQAGLAQRVSYKVASFDMTGLESGSADGAISIDVIWAIPDKPAGFAEAARILKRGARFVFTDWERDLSPPGYPPPVSDHRPLLEANGFEIEVHQLRPEADAMRRAFYQKMLSRQDELTQVLDDKRAQSNLREARGWLGLLDGVDYMKHSRRVLIVAKKAAA
jgi:ubiquinone/menaquinone biosynthesis C-methylase UbiE